MVFNLSVFGSGFCLSRKIIMVTVNIRLTSRKWRLCFSGYRICNLFLTFFNPIFILSSPLSQIGLILLLILHIQQTVVRKYIGRNIHLIFFLITVAVLPTEKAYPMRQIHRVCIRIVRQLSNLLIWTTKINKNLKIILV